MSENESDNFLGQLAGKGWNLDLDSIQSLLKSMGQPHRKFQSVHVAGTNGKGSTCAMLERILRQAGHKTGLFTSPHLIRVEERIRINGRPLPREEFSTQLLDLRSVLEDAGSSYFEALTALAFQCFAAHAVDIAIVETGMGGRFDATNVIHPLCSVITEIDFDHEEFLGKQRKDIAKEKSGIIKAGVPCVSLSTDSIVTRVFREATTVLAAPFYSFEDICEIDNIRPTASGTFYNMTLLSERFENIFVSLPGHVQVRNAALAAAAAKVLCKAGVSVSNDDIRDGLAGVRWPGRLQSIQESPRVVVDVAHNPGSINAAIEGLTSLYDYDRLIVVIGLLSDKNYQEISKSIAKVADAIFVVSPMSQRALSGQTLARHFAQFSDDVEFIDDFKEKCFTEIVPTAGSHDLICILGSHYLVGEFLDLYEKEFLKRT